MRVADAIHNHETDVVARQTVLPPRIAQSHNQKVRFGLGPCKPST